MVETVKVMIYNAWLILYLLTLWSTETGLLRSHNLTHVCIIVGVCTVHNRVG